MFWGLLYLCGLFRRPLSRVQHKDSLKGLEGGNLQLSYSWKALGAKPFSVICLVLPRYLIVGDPSCTQLFPRSPSFCFAMPEERLILPQLFSYLMLKPALRPRSRREGFLRATVLFPSCGVVFFNCRAFLKFGGVPGSLEGLMRPLSAS